MTVRTAKQNKLANLLESACTEADPVADEIAAGISTLDIGRSWAVLNDWKQNSQPVPDSLPTSLKEFFEESSSLPDWADPLKITLAQSVYSRYPSDILAMLLYAALPQCYAASDGAAVLLQTESMVKAPGSRLLSTAQFVVEVMTPGSLQSRGVGIRSIQKTRWIHAVIRQHLRKPEYQGLVEGVPINQEHMAGTLIAFSQVSIDALIKMGIHINEREQAAYRHIWAVIGHLLGVKDEYLPNSESTARSLAAAIQKRQHRPSEPGRQLMAELMKFAQSRYPPLVRGLPVAVVRYLSPETADLLAVPKTGQSRRMISTIRLGFLLREKIIRVLPLTRSFDVYNRLFFVKTLLWIERLISRRSEFNGRSSTRNVDY